jgi:hypothetical protein
VSLDSTVVSFIPFDIMEEKPGLYPPRFHIPASDMKIPSIIKISTCSHFVYLDESRGTLRVPDPSDQVARSICEDYIESQLGVDEFARPALFWLPDDLTVGKIILDYKDDIAKRLELQRKWFLNVSMLADNDWQRYHQHNVISSFQRKCADIIGWNPREHEWMSPMTTMESSSCPACGTSVVKDVIICPTCKCVLNETLAKEKGLKFAQAL